VQIHDFNPGFGPAVDPNGSNGLGDRVFWTTPIDASDVTVHFGAGKAELSISNLNMFDFLSKKYAFGSNWNNPPYGATVSVDVVWNAPVTRRLDFQDGTNLDHFGGSYIEDQATITWSASNTNGFTFTANPGSFSTSSNAFAELAQEQNGSFFSPDSSTTSTVVARSLLQELTAQQPPPASLAAPPISATLPTSGQAPPSVVTAPQGSALAVSADPGGAYVSAGNNDLDGELLFR
jgi:hypothetical protein